MSPAKTSVGLRGFWPVSAAAGAASVEVDGAADADAEAADDGAATAIDDGATEDAEDGIDIADLDGGVS